MDFVLRERGGETHYWPGLLPYRGEGTRRGRGYPTREAAQRRAYRIAVHYAATQGRPGPDLCVVERP